MNANETNAAETSRRVPGRPFARGQSGNPGGVSKAEAEARRAVKEILTEAGPEAAKRLRELIRSGNASADVRACMEILKRVLPDERPNGSNTQVNVSISSLASADLARLPHEVLIAHIIEGTLPIEAARHFERPAIEGETGDAGQ